MKCDLDDFTTYLIRGKLAALGVAPEDAKALIVRPCEGGAMESLASIRCEDQYGGEREVRRVEDLTELNAMLNDMSQLECLAQDVKRIREG